MKRIKRGYEVINFYSRHIDGFVKMRASRIRTELLPWRIRQKNPKAFAWRTQLAVGRTAVQHMELKLKMPPWQHLILPVDVKVL